MTFLPTAPSVRDALVADQRNYKDILVEAREENIQFQPRNPRQVKYARSIAAEGKKLGTDSLVTLHEIAYMLPGFVWGISSFPDVFVSFGDKSLLNHVSKCPSVFLSYDTTFLLGDFYLSVLVAKMSCFVENPCMPVAFLLHDRKPEVVHKDFFDRLRDKLTVLPHAVIVTDGEVAMSNAIKKALPSWNLVTCSNHILTDVEMWLKKRHANAQEIAVYKAQMQELMHCESLGQFEMKLNTLMPLWTEAFHTYFDEHLHSRVLIAYTGHLRSVGLQDEVVTNNISESFNAMLKRYQDWTEAPIDSMLIAMYRLQTYYLTEIQRSYHGFGPWTLRDSEQLQSGT